MNATKTYEQMTREELVAEWKRLNAELDQCAVDDYDSIFDLQSEVEDELDSRR